MSIQTNKGKSLERFFFNGIDLDKVYYNKVLVFDKTLGVTIIPIIQRESDSGPYKYLPTVNNMQRYRADNETGPMVVFDANKEYRLSIANVNIKSRESGSGRGYSYFVITPIRKASGEIIQFRESEDKEWEDVSPFQSNPNKYYYNAFKIEKPGEYRIIKNKYEACKFIWVYEQWSAISYGSGYNSANIDMLLKALHKQIIYVTVVTDYGCRYLSDEKTFNFYSKPSNYFKTSLKLSTTKSYTIKVLKTDIKSRLGSDVGKPDKFCLSIYLGKDKDPNKFLKFKPKGSSKSEYLSEFKIESHKSSALWIIEDLGEYTFDSLYIDQQIRFQYSHQDYNGLIPNNNIKTEGNITLQIIENR